MGSENSYHSIANHEYDDSQYSDSECASQRTPVAAPLLRKPPPDDWISCLLQTKFFAPCSLHCGMKKNESTYYCTTCVNFCGGICQHCLPEHLGHDLIQIRRYVYCDVVRALDMAPYVDTSGVQTYIINQAKVIFLNHRPQSKFMKAGSPDSCRTCSRSLREGCAFCSLACKVQFLFSQNCPLRGGTLMCSSKLDAFKHPFSFVKQTASPMPSSSIRSSDSELTFCRKSSISSEYTGRECYSRRKQALPRRSPYI